MGEKKGTKAWKWPGLRGFHSCICITTPTLFCSAHLLWLLGVIPTAREERMVPGEGAKMDGVDGGLV